MKIHVSEKAANWYQKELDLQLPAYIRFFPRYGGIVGIIPGFSLGINHNTPTESECLTKVNNITFFVESQDAWYFGDHDLKITLNEDMNEPEFLYESKKDVI